MRVLHTASARLFGGIERTLVTLARAESAAGGNFESWFALCARGRAVDEVAGAGGRVESLGEVRLSRPLTVLRARARVRQLVKMRRIDVVICHAPWAYALFAPVARRTSARLVWWQHDQATGRPLIERWARATRADLVISNSRWTSRSAAAIQPGVAVKVIYCPVQPSAFLSDDGRVALRASLATPASDSVVLCAARMEPWKGHLRLLRALAALRDLPAWTCWIAGGAQRPHEARYLDALRREAAALGVDSRVRWLGDRADVRALIAAADVLCQPNISPEPFGVVFAEALFSGIPVVTTNLGGAPEIVDAKCGRLVPPGDDGALTGALRELIVDPELRRRLGAAGPPHAASRCHPAVVMPRLAKALALTTRAAA